jgi:hypothetical protein
MKETGAKLRIVDLDAGFLKSTTENPAVVFQTPLRRQLGTTSKRVVRLPDAVNSDTVIGPREAFFLRQAVEATPTTTFFGSPTPTGLSCDRTIAGCLPRDARKNRRVQHPPNYSFGACWHTMLGFSN